MNFLLRYPRNKPCQLILLIYNLVAIRISEQIIEKYTFRDSDTINTKIHVKVVPVKRKIRRIEKYWASIC